MTTEDEFYEEDEPIEDVLCAYRSGMAGFTSAGPSGGQVVPSDFFKILGTNSWWPTPEEALESVQA